MENRSPFVLIGAAVILFIAAIAGFIVWKLRAGDDTAYAYYVILFSGDVQGLTVDSPVFYRGLRVGRVHAIQLAERKDIQRSTGRERLSGVFDFYFAGTDTFVFDLAVVLNDCLELTVVRVA